MKKLISVNFGGVCPSKEYGLKEIFSAKDGQSQKKCKALLEWLAEIGQLSKAEVEKRDHRSGGFENMPVGELKDPEMLNPLMELLDLPEMPAVLQDFRFGGGKYRLLGIFVEDTFYVAGMDWDFDLYNHGH